MELTLRPYVTAGVVVAGAGLIVAAPMGPAAVEIQTRAVQLASVDAALMAGQEFPIASWTDAYNDTVGNLQVLDQQISGDPTPILSQIEANLTGYANDLATGFQDSSTNLTNLLQELGSLLTTAVSDLQSGDVYDAITSISQLLLTSPLDVTRPIFNALFEIGQEMTNNLNNVLTPGGMFTAAAPDAISISAVPLWFTDLREAPLFGPNAADYAFAGVSQDIINAIQEGNTNLALSDLANAPSTILDAYFNGYQIDGGPITKLLADTAIGRVAGLDPTEGALNGGREAIIRAKEIIAGDLGGRQPEMAATAASTGGDLHTVAGDLSTLLNPDTPLGEFAAALDPNAVADLTSLLSGELAPNASTWVVDLFSGF